MIVEPTCLLQLPVWMLKKYGDKFGRDPLEVRARTTSEGLAVPFVSFFGYHHITCEQSLLCRSGYWMVYDMNLS